MKIRFLILFLFIQISLFAQKKLDFELNGYFSNMQSAIIQDINGDWINTNQLHNRLNFKSTFKNLELHINARTRFIYGDQIKYDINNFYKNSLEADKGLFDLSKNFSSGKSYVLNSELDRLYLNYQNQKIALTFGRQRINWGQTFVWNPNDLFNNYSFLDFDYIERPGSDAFRFQYFLNSSSRFDFATKINNKDTITSALLYGFNKYNTDFQLIAGYYNQTDFVFGYGMSSNVFKGLLRSEISYFISQKKTNNSLNIFLASVGYDYMLFNKLYTQIEFLYNNNSNKNGNFNLNDYLTTDISTKNISMFKYNYFISLRYQLNPLINTSLSGMYIPKNNIYFLIPSIDISLKDNLDFSLISQIYNAEISNQNISGGLFFIRLKYSL